MISSCDCSLLGGGSLSAPGVSASGSGTFVSIVEIQTHVQQLVVQKHISYNSIFNCSNGSPLWDPRNVSVSMNLTVSITCKVSCVRVIHCTHLASGNIGPENCMRFKHVCIIIDLFSACADFKFLF